MSEPFESQVFLAEFGHTDPSVNRSWKIRVGPGGNIYSFLGPMGEVMPPQKHDYAPWIDEVNQFVAVNNAKAHTPGQSWFIHQAGTYQKDGATLTERPFYSPSLARHCSGRTCTFAAWGQQAHVPTNWTSSAIYYTRYKDCGHGVLEVTYAVHNFGDSDDFDYNNVPWSGVRTTRLRDPLNAPPGGGGGRNWCTR